MPLKSGMKPQASVAELRESIGDISQVEVFHNQVLVGVYIKPELTRGGIILTDGTRSEDKWQGKVGAVLKMGPAAFVNDAANDFHGLEILEDEWILFRVTDGFSLEVNGVHCRLLEDSHVRGRVPDPTMIY